MTDFFFTDPAGGKSDKNQVCMEGTLVGGGQWVCWWRALAEKSNLNSMHLKQDRTQQIRKENMRFKANMEMR